VCENNLYNEYTHFHETTAGSVSARAEAFGLPAITVDGQDVRAVRGAALEAVERARRGDGPGFVVCETYRMHGHHVGDVDRAYYRSRDEETSWRERDPIALHGAWLLEQGLAGEDDLAGVEARVRSAVEAGVAFALAAPYPDADEVDEHVYA
jgi:acetoin:2,6-dichlorophenolindophenol oxidoreductase subunit alpha